MHVLPYTHSHHGLSQLQNHQQNLMGIIRWHFPPCWLDHWYLHDLLIIYVSALHRSQFCIFSFFYCPFWQHGTWDGFSDGVIYTKWFKWADGDLLKFLWRFNLSAVDCGHDMAVSLVQGRACPSKLKIYPRLENLQKSHLHMIALQMKS
jgi:hypothetical protein